MIRRQEIEHETAARRASVPARSLVVGCALSFGAFAILLTSAFFLPGWGVALIGLSLGFVLGTLL